MFIQVRSAIVDMCTLFKLDLQLLIYILVANKIEHARETVENKPKIGNAMNFSCKARTEHIDETN